MTTYLSSIASVGAAYGGWLEGVWEGATGVGVGTLGLVVGVRWGLAKWEGGKRRFWGDWRRVGEGLETDLQVSFAFSLSLKTRLLRSVVSPGLHEELSLTSLTLFVPLQDHLTKTAHAVLLAQPLAAAEGMETLVKKRRDVVAEQLVEVALLKERVEELQQGEVPVQSRKEEQI